MKIQVTVVCKGKKLHWNKKALKKQIRKIEREK